MFGKLHTMGGCRYAIRQDEVADGTKSTLRARCHQVNDVGRIRLMGLASFDDGTSFTEARNKDDAAGLSPRLVGTRVDI